MVLRATYALVRSGMTRAEVAARLPAILRRINPAGEGVAYRARPQHPTPGLRSTQAIGRTPAIAWRCRARPKPGNPKIQRPPPGLGYFAMGRIVQRANPDEAFRMFNAADKCSVNPANQPLCGACRRAAGIYQIAYGKGQRRL